MKERKYPIGIQTFSEIIRGRYVYIDKTDLVWQLANYAKYVFLSRPRRFGKSLLSTTLESYFLGDKELFEGLKIMPLEKEWRQYPVIHVDLSEAKNATSADDLKDAILFLLKRHVAKYGDDEDETTPGKRLSGLIRRAYQQAGSQVVVIVDEYDAPLLDVLHEEENLPAFRRVMQEFYQPLKACEPMVRFCFITGITKFSQLSIFSTLNNLTNVTMDPGFASICGITEQELNIQMKEDMKQLVENYGCSLGDIHLKLKLRYDGYHFSEVSEDIYNPHSLLSAFRNKKIDNYWFATGTPSFLIQQLRHFQTDITSLDKLEVPSSSFDQPTENMEDALPLLYQSGYLTIKDYDRETEAYTLSIPNLEVRIGYVKGLLPIYTGLKSGDAQLGFAAKFWKALKKNDIDLALREMQAYFAGIPYVEGFKKKLAEAATAEGFYEYTMYLVFSMLNVYVRTQVKCAGGRVDMVVHMPETTYVFELKTQGTAREALQQIDDRHYALPYSTDGKRVVKVGIRFDMDTRTLDSWAVDGDAC